MDNEKKLAKIQAMVFSNWKEKIDNYIVDIYRLQKKIDEQNKKYIGKNKSKLENINPPSVPQGKNKSDKEEIPFYVIFVSYEHEVYYPILCKKDDLICELEEKICEDYEQYKDFNMDLTCNGKDVRRFKTVEENRIKSGDLIYFNEFLN